LIAAATALADTHARAGEAFDLVGVGRAVVQQSVAAAAVSIVFPTGSAHAVQEASKEA
jgi:predicted HAD superfamily Cof-like phosphohydrolase